MASFVAAGTSLLAAIGNGEGQDLQPGQEFLFADMRTGVLFTLGATFTLAAISSALTQVSGILDNRELYRSLTLAGTPVEVMDSARMRHVRTPRGGDGTGRCRRWHCCSSSRWQGQPY